MTFVSASTKIAMSVASVRRSRRRRGPPRAWWACCVSFDSAMPASARISRPCSALVPSRRMTIGARNSTRRIASTIPLATSSPRVMPPKMLMKIDFTLWSKLITSSAAAITSALAPPPMSRKLAAAAADLVDDVERRHRQPGAVGDDPHRTLEPDVLQVVLAGQLLALVELLRGAELVPLRVAEGGVVVEADLGVERVHAAVGSRISGLISARSQSPSVKQRYSRTSMSATPSTARQGSCASTVAWRAVSNDEAVDRIDVQLDDRVGSSAATVSISTPPCATASACAAWRRDRA